MANVSEVITLGIGTPSSIPYFLTFGLGDFSGTPTPADTSRVYGGDPVRFSTQHITSYSDGDIRRFGSPEIRRFG